MCFTGINSRLKLNDIQPCVSVYKKICLGKCFHLPSIFDLLDLNSKWAEVFCENTHTVRLITNKWSRSIHQYKILSIKSVLCSISTKENYFIRSYRCVAEGKTGCILCDRMERGKAAHRYTCAEDLGTRLIYLIGCE